MVAMSTIPGTKSRKVYVLVELNVDSIKSDGVQDITDVSVGEGTLRSSSEVV